ncbi:MAG TPA: family 3 encapsulin nanocompartment shell protein [Candidatus Dormibacteraeota bacterium]|nr:family 3 encapsulin nanocompartment shell protein [Candidatus Dormibacteraeota bacterium]
MLLDDPSLQQRSPGQEFARACAGRPAAGACVTLRSSITTRFPLFEHRPRLTVRDLMKVAVVTSDVVTYARETAAQEGDHAIRSATSAPEAAFGAGVVQARVSPVTARAPVPAAILDDPAGLAALIDYRLLVRLCTAENDALLHGTGEGGIQGLLDTPGLRRQESRGSVRETILAAAARCEHYGGSADGIVMNPADWWPLVGEDGFLAGLDRVGLRINRTRLVPPGTAIVGDFQAGATVLDRQTATIQLVEEGGAMFAHGEFLEGLAVHLPGHFVLTSFT